MDFNLQEITSNIVSQIGFIVLLIMAVRALIAYTREDWGQFASGLVLGICCLIVVLFGTQIEDLARAFGDSIFG